MIQDAPFQCNGLLNEAHRLKQLRNIWYKANKFAPNKLSCEVNDFGNGNGWESDQ